VLSALTLASMGSVSALLVGPQFEPAGRGVHIPCPLLKDDYESRAGPMPPSIAPCRMAYQVKADATAARQNEATRPSPRCGVPSMWGTPSCATTMSSGDLPKPELQ